MDNLRQAAEMALEALEILDRRGGLGLNYHEYIGRKIEALREALAEPANSAKNFVEPVAWIEKDKDYLAVSADPFENAIPVYSAPPKQWIGLTDEEGAEIWADAHDIDGNRLVLPQEIVRRIEAKLKEKNGG